MSGTRHDRAEPRPAHGFEYDLGVLLVHGIGDQRRGSTLVDFGTPLVQWLTDRARQVNASAVLARACLTPAGDESASAELRIENGDSTRRWLFAETWWAESFAMRPFAEVASWSLAVVPWTFGSHFGRRLWRAFQAEASGLPARLLWCCRVASALVALLAGIGLSFMMLVLLSGLLVVGLIPWQRVRIAIQRVQVRLAATIGDSFILIGRPIEAAAILSRFNRDLESLARRCHRIAVVAHSQGGAVAALGLEAQPVSRVNLLITIGSGLRKLEELAELRQARTFQRGAALTVAGLVLVTLAALATPAIDDIAEVWMLAVYGVVGFSLLTAGVADFLSGPAPPRLRKLGRLFHERGMIWKDLYASADPVSNGPLHDDSTTTPPESIEVINHASMFSDHTSYWNNRDEFVTLVADVLLEYDAPSALPRVGPETVAYLRRRRRLRVMQLRVSGWVGAASVGGLLIRYADDWAATVGWSAGFVANRVAALLGVNLPMGLLPDAGTWGRSVGWLSLILTAMLAARGVWSKWDRLEMEKLPPYSYRGSIDSAFGVILALQLVVVGVAWTNGGMSGWLVASALAFSIGVTVILRPRAPPSEALGREPANQEKRSKAETAATVLWNLVQIAIVVIFVPGMVIGLFRWTRGVLARVLGVESMVLAVGAVVGGLLALIFFLTMAAQLTIRRRRARPGSN